MTNNFRGVDMPYSGDLGQQVFRATGAGALDEVNRLTSSTDSFRLCKDGLGRNALHLAVLNNRADIASVLVARWPELLSDTDNQQNTPLVLAANRGRLTVLLKMVRNDLTTEDATIDLYCSGAALLAMVQQRQIAAVKLLLAKKAKTDARTANMNNTPLMMSVLNQDVEMVELLLGKAVSQKPVNYQGKNAFQLAMEHKYWGCAYLLLQADLKAHDTDTYTPERLNQALLIAVKENQYQLASMLLRANANPDLVDEDDSQSRSLLHLAVQHDNAEMVALLLQHKAKVNEAFDRNGNTAVHLAVINQSLTIIRWFRAILPDCMDVKDEQGKSVRERVTSQTTTAGMLPVQSAALTNVTTREAGLSAMVLAIAKGDNDVFTTELSSVTNLSETCAPNDMTLLAYAVSLGHVGMVSQLLDKRVETSDDEAVASAFELACEKKDWHCAVAINPIQGLIRRLDDKYYHQLSRISLSGLNRRIKQRFQFELQNHLPQAVTEQAELYRAAAQSKTATYHQLGRFSQLMFWKPPQETNTSRLLMESADSLSPG